MEANTASPSSLTSTPEPVEEPSLVARAAEGEDLDGTEQDALLAHYLGNEPKPGQRHDGAPELHSIEVKLDPKGVRKWKCRVKSIRWEEWRDAQDKGTNKDSNEIDSFVISSYIVARALREPALGPVVAQLRDKLGPDKAPQDSAALLRDYFVEVPGSLMSISRKVVELSNLNEGNDAVREVEAGKT
jgi:hypothetical protein